MNNFYCFVDSRWVLFGVNWPFSEKPQLGLKKGKNKFIIKQKSIRIWSFLTFFYMVSYVCLISFLFLPFLLLKTRPWVRCGGGRQPSPVKCIYWDTNHEFSQKSQYKHYNRPWIILTLPPVQLKTNLCEVCSFTILERTYSWLKAPAATSAFIFKNLETMLCWHEIGSLLHRS